MAIRHQCAALLTFVLCFSAYHRVPFIRIAMGLLAITGIIASKNARSFSTDWETARC